MTPAAPKLAEMAGFAWGWARERISKWRLDRRRNRALIALVVGALLAAGAAGLLAVTTSSATSKIPDPSQTIPLDFAPSALLAADGLIYVGSAHGDLQAFDEVRDNSVGAVQLSAPVDYIVGHGDHIFAGGEESLTRLDPGLGQPLTRSIGEVGRHSTLRALAAGPAGVWGLIAGGSELVHFSSESLQVVQRFALHAEGVSLAVARRAVWVAARGINGLLVVGVSATRQRIARVRLGCTPSQVIAEHELAYALCPEARQVLVLTGRPGRTISRYEVGTGGSALAVANDSLWMLSPSLDHLSQYALLRHVRLGAPIGLGSEAELIAADQRAVWVAEGGDTLTGIDLQELSLARQAHGLLYKRSAPLGVPPWAFYLLDLLTISSLTVVLVLVLQNNINGDFPTFFPPTRLVPYVVHAQLFWDISSGNVRERTRGRARRVGTNTAIAASAGRAHTTTMANYPLAKQVRDNIVILHLKRFLYTGAPFVPGVRHRGLRRRPAVDPTERQLLEHWERVAVQCSMCVITGCTWLVVDAGQYMTFTLDYVLDRTAGHLREISRPAGAHLCARARKCDLQPIGLERCRPGERVRMDVIGNALPYSPGELPTMDIVVAWLPVKAARDISQLGSYVLSLRSKDKVSPEEPADR